MPSDAHLLGSWTILIPSSGMDGGFVGAVCQMKLTSHWVCMEGWGVGGSREQPLNGLVSQNGGLLREVFQCFTNDSIVAPSATMSKHLPPSSFPWTYRICKLLASPCPVWIRNVPSGNVPPKRMPEPKLQVQCIHTHQT